jgi:hypothetical protein
VKPALSWPAWASSARNLAHRVDAELRQPSLIGSAHPASTAMLFSGQATFSSCASTMSMTCIGELSLQMVRVRNCLDRGGGGGGFGASWMVIAPGEAPARPLMKTQAKNGLVVGAVPAGVWTLAAPSGTGLR